MRHKLSTVDQQRDDLICGDMAHDIGRIANRSSGSKEGKMKETY